MFLAILDNLLSYLGHPDKALDFPAGDPAYMAA